MAGIGAAAAGTAGVVVLGLLGVAALGAPTAAATCEVGGTAIRVDPATVPAGPIAGFGKEQLVNAAHVMLAGADLGGTARDQQIGVMTAIGESTLRVLAYGDTVGPDSRGLFQQRDNGAWGSLSDRMDPYISSTNFFKLEVKVDGRETMAPTLVAHKVQRNADPYHYERFWDDAGVIVQALSGRVIPAESPGTATASSACGGGVAGPVGLAGWAQPAKGPMTSNYGPRKSPGGIGSTWHRGIDFGGGGCDGPIWAANAGTVVKAGPAQGVGNQIVIEHGEGITTTYGHMYTPGVLVRTGDVVKAGQQIGKVGSDENSTGCHLHFGVLRGDQFVDPEAFLAQVGIDVGEEA